jgi:hypothetical protein
MIALNPALETDGAGLKIDPLTRAWPRTMARSLPSSFVAARM